MKKGELPINSIIIAAILLVVLVILWAFFTGRLSVWTSETEEITETEKNLRTEKSEEEKIREELFTCGNSILDPGETVQNCKGDIVPKCGNGICEPQFREHYGNCDKDCPESCVVDDYNRYSGDDECEYFKNRDKYEAEIYSLLGVRK